MRMHQGDNLFKYEYFKRKEGEECVTGSGGPFNWTGFKFVNLELKDSEIRQKYAPDCAQIILPES